MTWPRPSSAVWRNRDGEYGAPPVSLVKQDAPVPAYEPLLYELSWEQAGAWGKSHPGWEPEANPIPLMCSQPPRCVVYLATAPDQPQLGLNGGPSRAMSYFSNSAAMTSRSGWAPREIGPNSSENLWPPPGV